MNRSELANHTHEEDTTSDIALDLVDTPALVRPRRTLRQRLWYAAKVYALMIFVACVLAAFALALMRSGVDLGPWTETVRRLRPYGIAWQVIAAAAIVWRWPAIVTWAHRKGVVPAREVDQVVALRPKVAALLVAYIVLIPIGLQNLFGWLR
jgi:hypothetical protein